MTALIKRKLPDAPAPTREYRDKGKPITDIASVMVVPKPKTHRHKIFTNKQKDAILELQKQGLPYEVIARRYDTTSDTIRHIVCRENKKRADNAATLTAQKQ